MSKPEDQPARFYTPLAICVMLAVLVWAVFGQTLRYDFVNYDDDIYVYDNPVVLEGLTAEGVRWAFTHPHGHNWHPVTSLSHMLDIEIYGAEPGGHHFSNVLLHLATTLALFLLLRSMTGSTWKSAFAAAVFSLHPLRVESVAWISERKDVLSGLFFILTLMAYLRLVRRPRSIGNYTLVAVFFTLGLMSKPMLVTTPMLLLLLDFWPLGRHGHAGAVDGGRSVVDQPRTLRQLLVEKIPLFVITALFCGITMWAQKGALMPDDSVPLAWRIGNAVCAYVIYIRQLLLPIGLHILYLHPGPDLPVYQILICLMLLILFTLIAVAVRKKRPYILVGWLWYLGMLVPVIGIVQVGIQAHADRYTYLPHIGLILVITWLAAELSNGWHRRHVKLGTAGALIVIALSVGAWMQSSSWQSSLSLWSHAIKSSDDHFRAHANLGNALLQRGQPEAAILHLRESLQIYPDYAFAHNKLAVALIQTGDVQSASRHFRQAVRINPDIAIYHSNYGMTQLEFGNTDIALKHLLLAAEIDPSAEKVLYHIGTISLKQGNYGKAIDHFEQLLLINPEAYPVKNRLALLLATCPDPSLRDGRRAVVLASEVNNVAGGRDAGVLDTLAAAFAETGQYTKAVTMAGYALDIAVRQGENTEGLRRRIELYKSGKPYRLSR